MEPLAPINCYRNIRSLIDFAEQGDADAQYHLALMYHHGTDVEQDLKQAAKWYRQAAASRHPGALDNLGMMYQEGTGVQQDQEKGMKLIRQAKAFGVQLSPQSC